MPTPAASMQREILMVYDLLLAPFGDVATRSALVAVVSLSLGAGPVGVFLMLRRMSLMGDTMAHAILPGVAVGFLVAGGAYVGSVLFGRVGGVFRRMFQGHHLEA